MSIENIKLKSKDHLKQWLQESGRRWLVFNAIDLVDSLPFPEGVELFQKILIYYKEFRVEKPTGDIKKEKNLIDGSMCEVPVFHDEVLTNDEIDKAIYFLNTQKK